MYGKLVSVKVTLNSLQLHAVIGRRRELFIVAEYHASLIEHVPHLANTGSHDHSRAFSHPNGWLMSGLESMDRPIRVVMRCHGHIVLTSLSTNGSSRRGVQ